MPTDDPQFELEELGLQPAEAQVYLALIRNGSLAASAIANLTEIPRSSVYPTLNSLLDKGLIQGGAGYGSRFSAIPPDRALPTLVRHEREQLLHHESIVEGLSAHLASLAEGSVETAPQDVIQVIRNPRAVADRFDRLQLEADKQIDSWIKAPFFCRPSNPAQEKAQKRGVKVRSLYERAVLDDPAVAPFLHKWVAAGEEARIYDGELPHKLAIFDKQVVLMPLIMPADQTRTVLIRHPQLAQSLSMFFEFLWRDAEPINGNTSIEELHRPSRARPPAGNGSRPNKPAKA